MSGGAAYPSIVLQELVVRLTDSGHIQPALVDRYRPETAFRPYIYGCSDPRLRPIIEESPVSGNPRA